MLGSVPCRVSASCVSCIREFLLKLIFMTNFTTSRRTDVRHYARSSGRTHKKNGKEKIKGYLFFFPTSF
jgi:hypothetical protein